MNYCKTLTVLKLLIAVALYCVEPKTVYAKTITQESNRIDSQQQSTRAPLQTSQFGQLVGKWKVKDYTLNSDGKWLEGSGANWNFYWILGGTAIQDDWISPSLDKPAPVKGRQFGTNIRIYNPKLNQWDMAWASNSGAKVDTFSAKAKDQQLIMRGLFNGKDSQITFFNIKPAQFSWKLEQKDKTSDSWSEVYRIEAFRTE